MKLCWTYICKLFNAVFLINYAMADTEIIASFNESEAVLMVGSSEDLSLSFSSPLEENAVLWFTYHVGNDLINSGVNDVLEPLSNLSLAKNSQCASFTITGCKAGPTVLGVNSSSMQFEQLSRTFVRVTVVYSHTLAIINVIVGWLYFLTWSVSFYPQVLYNFSTKSVVGLNFDFLLYNFIGFLAYSFFNAGMLWVDVMKDEYLSLHPYGINPVQLNDAIFSLHAVFIIAVTIGQCFIYERGKQAVSVPCLVVVTCLTLFVVSTLIITLLHIVTWLTFLYYISYVKLAITLIKYIPQVWMNFRRKSTLGWSIANVLLDLTGGVLSLLQMNLLAFNGDDWSSILGDPTKAGLGIFSMLFDVLFIWQHYFLYRGCMPYKVLTLEKDVLIDNAEPNSDKPDN